LLIEHIDSHLSCARTQDRAGYPAREEVLHPEGDHGHPEDDHDRLQEPPDYVPGQLEHLIGCITYV